MIQCIPNFSEGRDAATMDAIADAAASIPGVRLAHRTADPDHNRMVLTLLGDETGVVAAAAAGAREAVARIDLTGHQGVHPRIGAVDVIPFVPLDGVPMSACISAARECGARIASELDVPVYLYGAASTRPDRRELPAVRGRGFEALRGRALTGDEAPDFGPPAAHPTAGAVAVGARARLIAFNVNLDTADLAVARTIASRLRERDGGLPGVRALGLPLASRGLVQVSINITEPDRAPLHEVFEAVRAGAAACGVGVAGAELVGACRLADLTGTTRHFLACEGLEDSQVLDIWPGVRQDHPQ